MDMILLTTRVYKILLTTRVSLYAISMSEMGQKGIAPGTSLTLKVLKYFLY